MTYLFIIVAMQRSICPSCNENPVYSRKTNLCKFCYTRPGKFFYPDKEKIKSSKRVPKPPKVKRKRIGLPFTINFRRPHIVPFTPRFIDRPNKKLQLGILKRYGIEFFNDLDRATQNPFFNLTDIGDKYGLTRERIRQIYKVIYGGPFNPVKKDKRATLEIGDPCINDPRRKVAEYKKGLQRIGAKSELLVFKKCKKLGFDVRPRCEQITDLWVNGHIIDVKSCTLQSQPHLSKYYHFSIRPKQFELCDFFICHIVPENSFYIIPKEKIHRRKAFLNGKSVSIYIRDEMVKSGKNLYSKNDNYKPFKEAWNLLKRNQEAICTN